MWLSKGRPTDELNERPLEGPISTARSCYTEIRNRTLHLSSNQICRFNTKMKMNEKYTEKY